MALDSPEWLASQLARSVLDSRDRALLVVEWVRARVDKGNVGCAERGARFQVATLRPLGAVGCSSSS
jgi:hypothetical protein